MISSNVSLGQGSDASGFAVALRHVKLDFAGEEILTDVGFEVPRGSFVCLVGPSGCGKSTTLRIIGGLLEATRGQVDVDQSTPAQSWQHLAYVFQAPRLVAWRTAYENVLLGMQLRTPDLAPDIMRDRALRYLEMLGLANEMDKFPGMLSGGQRQRVAIARALAVDPAIILMDEPFTALDYTTRRYLREQLIQIWQQTGKTILFVTHDLEEALYLADQVVVLSTKPTRTLQTLRLEHPRPRDVSADPGLSKHAETLRSLFGAMDSDRGKAKEAVPTSATVGTFAKIMGPAKTGFADRIIADGAVLLAFVAWYLYARVTPDFIMPNPVSVLKLTADLFFSQKYMIHTYTSFVRVLLSVSLSLLIGGTISFVGWYVRPLRLLVGNRIIPVLNAFPSLGWAILAVIWFGVNNFSVLFVEVAILLPFSMVNIWQGVKALDEETVEMSRSFTKSRKRIFARIMLPLLFPFIFSAIRVSYGVAWKVALIAELFGAEIGLGHLLNIASQNLNTTLVFAVILAMIVLVIGVERLVFDPLERRAQRHLVAAEESA